MDEIKKVDLEHFRRSRPLRRRRWRKRKIAVLAILVIVLFLGWKFFSTASSVVRYALNVGGPSFKQSDGRVNILLLGIGGGTHDGPNLTDSIILASYNLNTNEVTLFSIPRDLWLPGINQKINTAYTIGLAKGGDGLAYTEQAVSSVVGVPIHYVLVMDFSGFSRAIDTVGGVDVNVPDSFDDYQYPVDGKENDLCGWTQEQETLSLDQAKTLNVNPGTLTVYVDPTGKIATDSASLDFSCRYEHIHFDKGLTHMNGAQALEFVRSRHGVGSEGSDFARSRRQQLVIQAFRAKALSIQTLANPVKIAGLASAFGDSLRTDIPSSSYLDFYSLAKKVKGVNNIVLGELGNNQSLLVNPPLSDAYGGAWVLIPKKGDYSSIAKFVNQTLNPTPLPVAKNP